MADPRGFMKSGRQSAKRRPIDERVHDWKEVYPGGIGHALLPIIGEQAGRCMDCGIPFCHTGCPLGNLIPEWNDLVWRGDWDAALERLHATNNFPEFTGRLCPAPCEDACVVAIADEAVTIKNVEVSIIDKGWEDGKVHPQVTEWHTGSTVAVIGSGPAGLAAAQQLTRAGHTVAVLERDDKPGGLLRYGIPEYKMEKSVLDRRLDQMRAEGTNFKCGVEVGKDITGAALRDRFDAIIVATGATVPRTLDVPGADLHGVYDAMDYLTQANRVAVGETVRDQISATGKNVVIIGGGDTGNDCLGTAIRQGAASILQLEHNVEPPKIRAEQEPWPTYPRILRTSPANEEGGERIFRAATMEVVGDGHGNATGINILEVVRENGVNTAVEGSDQFLPADLILLAMGYEGPEGDLLGQLGVEINAKTHAVRNRDYSTAAEGVFVAGDAGRGQSLIVWAIAEGRACAATVDKYLSGSSKLPEPVQAHAQPIGR